MYAAITVFCTLFTSPGLSKYVGVAAQLRKFDGVLCFSFRKRWTIVQSNVLEKQEINIHIVVAKWNMPTFSIKCKPNAFTSSYWQSTGPMSTHQDWTASCTTGRTQRLAVWKLFGQSASALSGSFSSAWHWSQPELRSTSCTGPGPTPAARFRKWKKDKLMGNLLIARACFPRIVQFWVHPGRECNLLQSLCHKRCTLAVVVLWWFQSFWCLV